MSDSYIKVSEHGTLHSGPDAMRRIRAITIKSAIKMMGETNGRIIPTRGYSMKKGLAAASEFTGKKYKRTEWRQAIHDLQIWIDTMTMALPIIKEVDNG